MLDKALGIALTPFLWVGTVIVRGVIWIGRLVGRLQDA